MKKLKQNILTDKPQMFAFTLAAQIRTAIMY